MWQVDIVKIFNIKKNENIKYLIIFLIALPESLYLSLTVFDLNNKMINYMIIIYLLLLTGITFIFSKSKKIYTYVLLILFLIGVALLSYYKFENIIDYLNTLVINFINGYKLIHHLNIVFIIFLITINFFINKLFVIIIKSYYLQLIKTLALIITIWNYFESSKFVLTFIFTIVILFIFLEATTSFFSKLSSSKNTNYQIFIISLHILVISLTISVLTHNIKDPLRFIDSIQLIPVRESSYRTRIDEQNQITNLGSYFPKYDSTMLVVNSPYEGKLRGSTFDVYSSDEWSASPGLKVTQIDYQTKYLNKINFLEENNIRYKIYDLDVSHIVLSKILYTPANSYIEKPKSWMKSNQSVFYYSESVLDKDINYQVNTIKINYNSKAFVDLIRSLKVNSIDSSYYLQLPNNFNEDIRKLALEITRDEDSVYDKARAIEYYLSNNFEYDTTPIDRPYYYDYVEFFLFESKEGFCSHYASTMVLMLRSIGIPSRYVVGYVLDNEGLVSSDLPELDKSGNKSGDSQTYYVKKNKSHAWVEVNFEGYGWLEFEPTSSYYQPLEITNMEDNIILTTEDKNIEIKEIDDGPNYFGYMGLSTLLISVVIYYLSTHLKITNKEKIVKVMNQLRKKITKELRLRVKNETAREFINTVGVNNQNIDEILNIYEQACYSKRHMTNDDVLRIKKLFKAVKRVNLRKDTYKSC